MTAEELDERLGLVQASSSRLRDFLTVCFGSLRHQLVERLADQFEIPRDGEGRLSPPCVEQLYEVLEFMRLCTLGTIPEQERLRIGRLIERGMPAFERLLELCEGMKVPEGVHLHWPDETVVEAMRDLYRYYLEGNRVGEPVGYLLRGILVAND